MSALISISQRRLFWHWMRKDFTVLRGWLLAWLLLLGAHLALRCIQLHCGELSLPAVFRSTSRPDHWLQWVLLVMTVPMVMQQDSATRGHFWKSRPIRPGFLLAEKLSLLLGWFVLLPLVLDLIYFRLAGFQNADLMSALVFWAAPRATLVLVLSALAGNSKSLGKFVIHLTLGLFVAGAGLLFLGVLPRILINDPNQSSLWSQVVLEIENPITNQSYMLMALNGIGKSLMLFSGVAALGYLALRYLQHWGNGWSLIVSVLLPGIGYVCYLGFSLFNALHRGPRVIPPLPLMENPEEIPLGLTLDKEFLSRRDGLLGTIRVRGFPKNQSRNIGLSEEIYTAAQGPAPLRFHDHTPSQAWLNFQHQGTYLNFDELRFAMNDSSEIRAWPYGSDRKKFPDDMEKFRGSILEIDFLCRCGLSEASLAGAVNAGSGESISLGPNEFSFRAHPEFERLHLYSKGTVVLGQNHALEIVDPRFALHPYVPNSLVNICLAHAGGAVGIRNIRSGKILLIEPDSDKMEQTLDLTRFRSLGLLPLIDYVENSLHKPALDGFQKQPEEWEIILVAPKKVSEFALPIHLTKEDLLQAFPKSSAVPNTELNLHFNPATQRWETSNPY